MGPTIPSQRIASESPALCQENELLHSFVLLVETDLQVAEVTSPRECSQPMASSTHLYQSIMHCCSQINPLLFVFKMGYCITAFYPSWTLASKLPILGSPDEYPQQKIAKKYLFNTNDAIRINTSVIKMTY